MPAKKKIAAKKVTVDNERYYFIGALVVIAALFVVLSYLLGVQHTINALGNNLPF